MKSAHLGTVLVKYLNFVESTKKDEISMKSTDAAQPIQCHFLKKKFKEFRKFQLLINNEISTYMIDRVGVSFDGFQFSNIARQNLQMIVVDDVQSALERPKRLVNALLSEMMFARLPVVFNSLQFEILGIKRYCN